jgi:hypothetical protein
MNKFVGFMNVVLLSVILISLAVGGVGSWERAMLSGMVVMLVPIALTIFAMEPGARFLYAAFLANAAVVGLSAMQSGATLFLVPFAINMVAVALIWFRVREERKEAAAAAPHHDQYAEAAEPTYEPEEPARNYFLRHWRGQFTLPASYWVNNWGATTLCWGLIVAANKLLADISLRMQSATVLALHVVLLLVACWCAVGVWRSAGYHPARGGARVWAAAAQFLVVLGTVGTLSNFFVYNLPQMKEHWLIARDQDPLGYVETQLTRDRKGLVLSGALGAGSAEKIRAALDGEPNVETLVLETPGGRVGEAALIAQLVRERKLKTYVDKHCESACTVILLAGADRAVTADARVGFHRASFPGMSPAQDKAMTDDLIKQYREAGLPDDFLARVRETQAEDMWYPTRNELLAAHAIDRISTGGEINRVAKYDTKVYLEFQYAGDAIMGLINDHFRGAVAAAAAAAWKEREQGATDAVMWAAARKVILGYYQKLLSTADEPSLRSYLQIRLDQLRAAQNVSAEACALQADSRLDISQALSGDLYDRELTWVQAALKRRNHPAAPAVNASQFNQLMRRLEKQLGADIVTMARNPTAHIGQPQQLCDASLQFYETIRTLPSSERVLAARGLFQGVAQ